MKASRREEYVLELSYNELFAIKQLVKLAHTNQDSIEKIYKFDHAQKEAIEHMSEEFKKRL